MNGLEWAKVYYDIIDGSLAQSPRIFNNSRSLFFGYCNLFKFIPVEILRFRRRRIPNCFFPSFLFIFGICKDQTTAKKMPEILAAGKRIICDDKHFLTLWTHAIKLNVSVLILAMRNDLSTKSVSLKRWGWRWRWR